MKVGLYIGALVLGLAAGAWASAPLFEVPTAQAQALTPQQKAALQAEYDQLQQEIAQWQKVLDETRAKKNTIQGDVSALDAQIKKAETEIKQRNNTITRLGSEINEKTKHISTLESRLGAGRESLAKLMRQKNEIEQQPLAILALSSQDLSEFFSDIQSIETLNSQLQELFEELRGVKQETEAEKQALAERQNKEFDARYEVQTKQAKIAEDKKEKDTLLSITKKEETAYQSVLAERQRRAEQIRSALFELRDAGPISFGQALQYAQAASAKTGVRPAFILGILQQESNLGQNVGTCIITNLTSGQTKHVNSGKVYSNGIHPTRDLPVLQTVLSELGRDPLQTRVSCPLSIGYGGAMGPAQFIPSTWYGKNGAFKKVIANATGKATPDPWNPADAIMASALLLRDLGAGAGTPSAERTAACRYYGGGTSCTGTTRPYGDQVMSKAAAHQQNIDFLNDL